MRTLGRTLLVLALVVGVGVALVVWLGQGVPDGDPPGPDAGPRVTAGATSPPATGGDGAAEIPADAIAATVRYVHDGDTLYLTEDGGTEVTVRLIGIDTPEVGDNAECFGDEARDRLRALLPEGTRVFVLAEQGRLDQYGRTLLHVFLPDGTHINRLLIDEGYAWAMFFDPNRDYEAAFRAAQAQAESADAGMWASCGY